MLTSKVPIVNYSSTTRAYAALSVLFRNHRTALLAAGRTNALLATIKPHPSHTRFSSSLRTAIDQSSSVIILRILRRPWDGKQLSWKSTRVPRLPYRRISTPSGPKKRCEKTTYVLICICTLTRTLLPQADATDALVVVPLL